MEHVILVNDQDDSIGTMEKMEAHEKGVLHRAFSVFLFNEKGEMLLQQRAKDKYHSGGLWTNTCCSHPRPKESTLHAATRRLMEEMGIETQVHEIFQFIYKAKLDRGLIEHELDHVFFGHFDGEFEINKDEVESARYISKKELLAEVDSAPESFTEWFKIALPEVLKHWDNYLLN